jgi:HSP20 family protein
MTVMRFDPFGDFDRLSTPVRGRPRSVLSMDAVRRGDQVVVHFDLPGVDPGSVEVTVEKNLLTVNAERPTDQVEGEQVFVNERPTGRFSRQLRLGDGLDVGQVHADYHNGVLTVTLPVGDEIRPRRVEINTVNASPVIEHTEAQDGGSIEAPAA